MIDSATVNKDYTVYTLIKYSAMIYGLGSFNIKEGEIKECSMLMLMIHLVSLSSMPNYLLEAQEAYGGACSAQVALLQN